MYLKATAKSRSLMRSADFHVILPYHDGYPDAKRPYPVLYFLPGFSCSAEELVFGLPFRQMSALCGVAVVIPDGENAFYTDHPERCASMGQYIAEELPELAHRLFPCLSDRPEDTFLGGISMGGYGAAVLGLHYSPRFSKLILFSPSAEPDTLLLDMPDHPAAPPSSLFGELLGSREEYAASPRLNPFRAVEAAKQDGRPIPDIWMCCGEEDLAVKDACLRFEECLQKNNVPCRTVHGHGDHDYLYWDAHLEEAFRFLRETPEA